MIRFCLLSGVYAFFARIDRKIKSKNAVKLAKPAISVGNIPWGGTGKTPVVIKLARLLSGAGKKVCVLSRGYKRKISSRGPVVVSDGAGILSSVEESGDEPMLIARSVPGAIVICGKDRGESAALALKNYNVDVFILDDGFQHWKVLRDLDIVCVNAKNPFGNGCLIPAGILREPLSELKRAGLIVINNTNFVRASELEAIEREIAAHCAAPVVRSALKAEYFARLDGSLPDARPKAAVLMSAIANNDLFKASVESLGVKVLKHYQYRDHFKYSEAEVSNALSGLPDGVPVIVTAKDAVKISRYVPKDSLSRVLLLDNTVEFNHGEQVWLSKIRET